MYYYAASTMRPDVFGSTCPAPGVRVAFDEARLTAYGPRKYLPVVHRAPGPQGLVVFWTPLDVLTWPCRLWRVDDLADPVTVSTHPFYLRCTAFTVVDELPSWQVFGPHGDGVARLESEIGELTAEQVDVVAARDGAAEWETYLAVMHRWRKQVDSAPHEGRMHSPIGNGLAVIRDAADLAAARTSSALFDWVEDASEYPVLADPRWRSVRQAAMTTALAVGAPNLLHDKEYESLTARWRRASTRR
jgi:hypothetical protein